MAPRVYGPAPVVVGSRGWPWWSAVLVGRGGQQRGPRPAGLLKCAMPTYVYEVLNADGTGTGQCFELVQSMKDKALTKHPETGAPVRRVPQMPTIAGKWSDIKSKSTLSDKNLERLGFTKYERKGKGYMERTAGKLGPKSIAADD
jgi:predicted nucleic acid-binding Zn ribbon protein